MKPSSRIIYTVFLGTVLCGCGITSPSVSQNNQIIYHIPKGLKVFIPGFHIEIRESEESAHNDANTLNQWNKNLHVLTAKTLADYGLSVANGSEPDGSLASKNKINLGQNTQPYINEYCELKDIESVYLSNVKIHIGNSDEWAVSGLPPLVFSIRPKVKNSYTHIRSVIVSCNDYRLIWKGEVLIRSLPDNSIPENELLFSEGYKSLFNNIDLVQ